jgi:hypothetical protein
MRQKTVGWVILALLVVGPAWGQEGEGAGDEAMQAMMQLGEPGEHHKHLAWIIGDWSYTAKMWVPGAPEPIDATGTMTAEAILGGRFVKETWTGEFFGQPFLGIGVEGFDNFAGHYTSTWRDNMGTYTLSYTGGCEDSGKKRTMTGTFVEPASGEEVTDRGTTTLRDDGTILMESWRVIPGAEDVKNMEIVLTRK